jgi:hypothetical protein
LASVAGLLLGGLGRNLPVALATAALPDRRRRSCDMQEVLDCAFRNAPGAIGTLVKLGLVTALVAVVAVVLAVVLALLAVRWLRRGERPVGAPVLMGLAVALVVPAFWLGASLLGAVILG